MKNSQPLGVKILVGMEWKFRTTAPLSRLPLMRRVNHSGEPFKFKHMKEQRVDDCHGFNCDSSP